MKDRIDKVRGLFFKVKKTDDPRAHWMCVVVTGGTINQSGSSGALFIHHEIRPHGQKPVALIMQ